MPGRRRLLGVRFLSRAVQRGRDRGQHDRPNWATSICPKQIVTRIPLRQCVEPGLVEIPLPHLLTGVRESCHCHCHCHCCGGVTSAQDRAIIRMILARGVIQSAPFCNVWQIWVSLQFVAQHGPARHPPQHWWNGCIMSVRRDRADVVAAVELLIQVQHEIESKLHRLHRIGCVEFIVKMSEIEPNLTARHAAFGSQHQVEVETTKLLTDFRVFQTYRRGTEQKSTTVMISVKNRHSFGRSSIATVALIASATVSHC
jgi:hypothetical protein